MSQQPRHLHLKPTDRATEPTPKPEPALSHLNSSLVWSYAPSPDGLDSNLLIFLHGLGDTHHPFFKLGQFLKLPQTAILSLRAPDRIPLLPEEAYQWCHSFDELGDMISRPDPTPALELLSRILDHLRKDCKWPNEALHLFGFAQGGSVACEAALAFSLSSSSATTSSSSSASSSSASRLGSVVSVSGPMLSFPTPRQKSTTPVLLWKRSEEAATTPSGPLRKGFEQVTEHTVQAKGAGGMPRSQPEWLPIMKYVSVPPLCLLGVILVSDFEPNLVNKLDRFWSQHLRRLQPWELASSNDGEPSQVHEVIAS